jgi:hypothetical protein
LVLLMAINRSSSVFVVQSMSSMLKAGAASPTHTRGVAPITTRKNPLMMGIVVMIVVVAAAICALRLIVVDCISHRSGCGRGFELGPCGGDCD